MHTADIMSNYSRVGIGGEGTAKTKPKPEGEENFNFTVIILESLQLRYLISRLF